MRSRIVLALVLLSLPVLSFAGPNAGGVLLVHANTSIVYTVDNQGYCGQSGLEACSLAVTSVPWDPERTTVFFVLAAFPDTAHPRLKAISWGVEWDDSKLEILAHGTCADFDVPDGGWPASDKGIGQSFLETQTGLLTECYWFAAYAYSALDGPDSTSLAVVAHPVQGGAMADDGTPPTEDPIEEYGRLGFGSAGSSPCSSLPGSDGDTTEGPSDPDTPGDPDSPDEPPELDPCTHPEMGIFRVTQTSPLVIHVDPGPDDQIRLQLIQRAGLAGAQLTLAISDALTGSSIQTLQPTLSPGGDIAYLQAVPF